MDFKTCVTVQEEVGNFDQCAMALKILRTLIEYEKRSGTAVPSASSPGERERKNR
jgi:hypothetical protein